MSDRALINGRVKKANVPVCQQTGGHCASPCRPSGCLNNWGLRPPAAPQRMQGVQICRNGVSGSVGKRGCAYGVRGVGLALPLDGYTCSQRGAGAGKGSFNRVCGGRIIMLRDGAGSGISSGQPLELRRRGGQIRLPVRVGRDHAVAGNEREQKAEEHKILHEVSARLQRHFGCRRIQRKRAHSTPDTRLSVRIFVPLN